MWYRFKDKLFDFKMRCQRFKRGYADVDVWEIDTWFLNIIPEMLKQLRDHHNGVPMCVVNEYEEMSNGDNDVDKADKLWCSILDDMIYCFEQSTVETPDCDDVKVYMLKDEEMEKYRQSMKKKALELFVKYFDCLWD